MEQPPLFDGVVSPELADELCVTACNHSALTMVRRWLSAPSGQAVVTGEAGAGKTTLIAEALRYVAGSILAPECAPDNWCAGLSPPYPCLVCYDAPCMPDSRGCERLFHALNLSLETGVPLLVFARPAFLDAVTLPDLASRLKRHVLAVIPPPDDEMLRLLIAKAFVRRQIIVSDAAAAYLAPRLSRSYRAPEEAAAKLDALALARKRPVTVRLIKELYS